VLYLSFYERNPDPRPWDALLDRSEWFSGAAWQASAGVEFAVSPTVGILGEVGMHRSEPSKDANYLGDPVELRVPLNGGFLRAGVRVGF